MSATLTIRDESATGQLFRSFLLELPMDVTTVRELIRARVEQEVSAYNARPAEAPFNGLVQPVGAEVVLNGFKPRRAIDAKEQADRAVEASASGLSVVAHLSPRRPGFSGSHQFPTALSRPISKTQSPRNDRASRCGAWVFDHSPGRFGTRRLSRAAGGGVAAADPDAPVGVDRDRGQVLWVRVAPVRLKSIRPCSGSG